MFLIIAVIGIEELKALFFIICICMHAARKPLKKFKIVSYLP